MRLVDIFEADLPPPREGSIRLYRGDSTKIEQFNTDQTNLYSLFGGGIYLTDNRRVAGDYTSKSFNKGDVIFTMSSRRPLTKKEVLDKFINQIASKIDHNGVDHSRELEYWSKSVPFSDGTDWQIYIPRVEEERKQRMKMAIAKWIKMSKDYEIRSKLDNTAVIQKKIKRSNAAISVFDVPLSYVKNTIHADYKIDDKILGSIYWVLDRYHDNNTANDIKQYIRRNEWEGDEVSFRAIYTALTVDCPLVNDENAQKDFRNDLIDHGYVGVEYVGGTTMGGGYRHRAYVFWDSDMINKYRVA